MTRLALSAALVGLALSTGAGCFETPTATDEPLRWARRFLPFEAQWRAAGKIPNRPQTSPKMVIWELTSHAPDAEASAEQRQRAVQLTRRAEQVAKQRGWYDFQTGLAAGYKLLFADRRHYANQAFIMDEHVLDPERPEFLMYYGTPQGKQLAGMMFYTQKPEEPGPQIGGPLTIWHYHVWSYKNCLLRGLLLVGLPDKQGRCKRGVAMNRSPEMLHIWLVDHPRGPFSTSMFLEPELMRELLKKREQRWAAEAAS